MERTKILYGTDRLDQLPTGNNVQRPRLVAFFFIRRIDYFLFNRRNFQLPLTSQQPQFQSSDNKQLSSNELLTDEVTPTHPDISFP